jgi:protein involved in polysaccharide export with SLBB domain
MNRTLTLLKTLAGLGLCLAATVLLAQDTATNAPVFQPVPPAGLTGTNTSSAEPLTEQSLSATNGISTLSASSAARAQWQQHLTLGPGDILSISLIDQPDSLRNDITIGPDGRVNYLEAQNFMAAGYTVDEMRSNLDQTLGQFYRSPRSIVIPLVYKSKRFFMLGAVAQTGVFTLDKPTSIIEAVARAGGLQTGVFDRSPAELADLSHSFLVRSGKRIPVDFEDLFLHGDLSQNIPVEPDDYLFFAPANLNEVYVVGSVNQPGAQPWERATTVISAITRHGSFAPNAWRQRVLVVRGSLNNPKTFVINTADILSAKTPDFPLEPHDIVYVHDKPWAYARDLVAGAATSFVQAALVTYTGHYIGPLITKPFLHP